MSDSGDEDLVRPGRRRRTSKPVQLDEEEQPGASPQPPSPPPTRKAPVVTKPPSKPETKPSPPKREEQEKDKKKKESSSGSNSSKGSGSDSESGSSSSGSGSDSDSSSSSGSSATGSDHIPLKKKVSERNSKPAQKRPSTTTPRGRPRSATSKPNSSRPATTPSSARKRGRTSGDESDDESSDDEPNTLTVTTRNRDKRVLLVAQFLRRWWYALPSYPPEDWDPTEELCNRKLKKVDIEEWDDTEDVDEAGFTKVYQLSQFRGVFRDPHGNAHDLRPKENRPSQANFLKKTDEELYELIITAVENQLKELREHSVYDERDQILLLEEELSDAKTTLDKIRRNK